MVLAAGGVYLGYKLFEDKLKKVDDKVPEINTTPDIPTPSLPAEIPKNDKVIPTNTATPSLPETIALSPTSVRRKRRTIKARQPINIMQRTNIVINNQTNRTKLKTKKYLNATVL
jgi:hypothetical protein